MIEFFGFDLSNANGYNEYQEFMNAHCFVDSEWCFLQDQADDAAREEWLEENGSD